MTISFTPYGTIGDDGVHRDLQGNEIPGGYDPETKAALQASLDGPRVRVLPSENDVFKASVKGHDATPEKTTIDPFASKDAREAAFTPGYDVVRGNKAAATADVPSGAVVTDEARASEKKSK